MILRFRDNINIYDLEQQDILGIIENCYLRRSFKFVFGYLGNVVEVEEREISEYSEVYIRINDIKEELSLFISDR